MNKMALIIRPGEKIGGKIKTGHHYHNFQLLHRMQIVTGRLNLKSIPTKIGKNNFWEKVKMADYTKQSRKGPTVSATPRDQKVLRFIGQGGVASVSQVQ